MTLQIDSATTAAAFTDTASRPRMPAIAKMEIISLDPTKLQKSPGNKREYDEKRSAKYGRNWDSFLAGTIHCAFRDGIYWCIDGWHRRNGAIFAGESTVRVLVIHGYSEADDARAFDFLNTERVKISAANEFWARVDYGHPTALAVMDVCTKADVRLPVPSPSGSIGTKQYRTDVCAAFAALQLVVDRDGPECLFETLKTIRAAWPDDPRAWRLPPSCGCRPSVPCTGHTPITPNTGLLSGSRRSPLRRSSSASRRSTERGVRQARVMPEMPAAAARPHAR